jgi:hypothetical protein
VQHVSPQLQDFSPQMSIDSAQHSPSQLYLQFSASQSMSVQWQMLSPRDIVACSFIKLSHLVPSVEFAFSPPTLTFSRQQQCSLLCAHFVTEQ